MIIDIQKLRGVSSYSPEGIIQKITEVKKYSNIDNQEKIIGNSKKVEVKYNALITQIYKLLAKTNSGTKKFLLEYIK